MKSLNEQPKAREIYVWNIVGSIANAMLSVVVLMLVTRTLDGYQQDVFSIAWSISQLMVTIGTFQIRVYQATDVNGRFRFRQYLIFRIVTIAIMMLCSGVYIYIRHYNLYKAMIVLILTAYRGADSLADVYEGWFQQKERLDLSGKALAFRIVYAVIGFGGVLYISRNLMWACLILLASFVLCFFIYDLRYMHRVDKLKDIVPVEGGYQWIVRMFIAGFPLFINSFFIASIMNEPKMVIDAAIAGGDLQQGVQAIFNILFMPASVLSLAYIVFRPLITRMAVEWNKGKIRRFLGILMKIIAALFVMGIMLILGGTILGIPVLSYLYAIDLADYRIHLMWIMIGGCFYTFAAVLDNAMVVIRKQYILIIAYVITWIYSKAITQMFVDRWKLLGAALAYTTAMVVFLLATVILFVTGLWAARAKNKVEIDDGSKESK